MVSTRIMILKTGLRYPSLRLLIAAFWISLCLLIVGAPVLAEETHFTGSSVIYYLFSSFCHQIPERSFSIAGFPFAVCHRCFGIYLGLALGSLIPVSIHSPAARRTWIAAATVPLMIDVVFPYTGLWDSAPAGRFLTGLVFGTMLATFFVQGILELFRMETNPPTTCKGEV
jgi:uncharacterized membrane protein